MCSRLFTSSKRCFSNTSSALYCLPQTLASAHLNPIPACAMYSQPLTCLQLLLLTCPARQSLHALQAAVLQYTVLVLRHSHMCVWMLSSNELRAIKGRLVDRSPYLAVQGEYHMYITQTPHIDPLMFHLALQQNNETDAVCGAEKTAFAWYSICSTCCS